MRHFIVLMVALGFALTSIHAEEPESATSIRYWIDDNHSAATSTDLSEFDVDCSSLTPGFHTLNYQVFDSRNTYSPLYLHIFYKLPMVKKASKIETLQYWWDDMTSDVVTESYSENTLILTTDNLPYGLHSLKYRVMDDAGNWSRVYTSYFFKGEPREEAAIVSYAYWWNDLKDRTSTVKLETPSKNFELEEDFIVPKDARTDFAGPKLAKLNIALYDNRGRGTLVTTDVEYSDKEPTSVSEMEMPDCNIYSIGKDIVIENSEPGKIYQVFDLQGLMIGEVIADSDRTIFRVAEPGVYLIKSGTDTTKILCR